ncbi:MAG: hypothetical protein JJU11_16770 [Candidatus Sumerlaeia bacterium]|nr:hypothetical protein [Candidatus Sumerlaeia bacterium]
MRTLLSLVLLGAVCVVIFLLLYPGNDGKILDDREAIEELFDTYYDALRGGRFDEAASYYEPGSEEIMGGNLADSLRLASGMLDGIPEETRLSSLRIDGNRATGEVVIPDQEQALTRIVETDREGNIHGTWARSIHFVKHGDQWKISQSGENIVGLDPQQALEILRNLQDGNTTRPE